MPITKSNIREKADTTVIINKVLASLVVESKTRSDNIVISF